MPRSINLRCERDFSDKLNATFQFATENWRDLLNVLLFLVLPIAMLAGVANAYYQVSVLGKTQEMARQASSLGSPDKLLEFYTQFFGAMFSGPYVWLVYGLSLLASLLLALSTYGYMLAYVETDESPISLNTVWGYVKRDFWKALANRFIVFVAIVPTFVFLVGFYFFLPWVTFPVIIIMAERRGVLNSIGRSNKLIYGKWWSTFGLLLILAIITSILSLLFNLPLGIMQVSEMGRTEPSIAYTAVSAMALGLGYILYALLYIGIGFQYFNLVERQEGTSLLDKID